MRESRTPAQVFRAFADGEAVGTMYSPVARALSESDAALRALQDVPVRRRHPRVVLAALHDLALAGRAPALAAAYVDGDGAAAGPAAVGTVLTRTDELVRTATRRRVPGELTGHAEVLYPAIAEAGRRGGATTVGLIDVGSPGFNLLVDRVGIAYSSGSRVGDPMSPVQLTAAVVGPQQRVPTRGLPEVVARIVVDEDPVDVSDEADIRWLRACLRPDQTEQRAKLDAELAVAASDPPVRLAGAVEHTLPDALARIPASALPVVLTTWSLSRLSVARRLEFHRRLSAAGRPVAWVSVEGVGVAPGVPTLGDRPASGHSIVGLAFFAGGAVQADVLGRCWSRGGLLSWLAPE